MCIQQGRYYVVKIPRYLKSIFLGINIFNIINIFLIYFFNFDIDDIVVI